MRTLSLRATGRQLGGPVPSSTRGSPIQMNTSSKCRLAPEYLRSRYSRYAGQPAVTGKVSVEHGGRQTRDGGHTDGTRHMPLAAQVHEFEKLPAGKEATKNHPKLNSGIILAPGKQQVASGSSRYWANRPPGWTAPARINVSEILQPQLKKRQNHAGP